MTPPSASCAIKMGIGIGIGIMGSAVLIALLLGMVRPQAQVLQPL